MPVDSGRILYKDEHYLAVHKLAGELTVRGKGPMQKLPLLDFLRRDYPELRPVNRLDFDTSGIVLFARTRAALAAFMLKSGKNLQVEKHYRVILLGSLPHAEGVIRKALPARTIHKLVPTETRYKVLERFPDATYVEASFTTGRHHQLRRHFAFLKHPLACDPLYADAKANAAFTRAYHYRKYFLHAFALSFVHPFTGIKVVIEAPLPRVFEMALQKMRKIHT